MRLSISDAAFIPGRGNWACGHLIWPEKCPAELISILELDQGYRGMCMVEDQGKVVFSGQALVKRRLHHGHDQLVIMLPDINVGHLSSGAKVEIEPCKLAYA